MRSESALEPRHPSHGPQFLPLECESVWTFRFDGRSDRRQESTQPLEGKGARGTPEKVKSMHGAPNILRLVLGRGLVLAVTGLAAGVAASLLLTSHVTALRDQGAGHCDLRYHDAAAAHRLMPSACLSRFASRSQRHLAPTITPQQSRRSARAEVRSRGDSGADVLAYPSGSTALPYRGRHPITGLPTSRSQGLDSGACIRKEKSSTL